MNVTLSSSARRDLKRLDRPDKDRIVEVLARLGEDPPPDNLDIVPLTGHAPWRRLRFGVWRVLFRPVDDAVLVARVVNRRDLKRAAKDL